MRWCEFEVEIYGMRCELLRHEPCDLPAKVKHHGKWYCEGHYEEWFAYES